jgi:hypothetical protein
VKRASASALKALLFVTTFILQQQAIGAPFTHRTEAVAELAAVGVQEIVYTVRGVHGDGHWYANIGYHAGGANRVAYNNKIASKLVRYHLQTGRETVLLEDKTGGIRDPQVHYDAQKILFSYRKGGEAQYHLYEINIDGSNLRQLTNGIFDDYEPSYLPDGGIVFVSTRARRWVNCWNTQVGTIYRCDGGGKNIRSLSANIEHDNTPWVLPDGRIMYTRWEYVDRSQRGFHHLWTMNPDGSNQAVLFGNMHRHDLFIDAKPIPGSDQVVVTKSPGHGQKEHMGHLSVLSLQHGPDDKKAMKPIRKTFVKDPYALSENLFLAVSCDEKALSVIDKDGKTISLLNRKNGKKSWETFHEPRPLIKRNREKLIPSRIDVTKTTGTLVLQNANIGRNMAGVKQGDITKLLILETLPKPINYIGDFFPLSWGGTFTLEGILGTVPVEADGSAHFEVPANRSLVLVALDKEGKTVKRMHSFLSVAPGETLSCIGCHEDRTATPPNSTAGGLLAMKRPVSTITAVPGIPTMIDYRRDIQPIWDKNCLSCHNPDNLKGDVDLSSDTGLAYTMSYLDLFIHDQVSDARNGGGNYAPRTLGDVNSQLMNKLSGKHYKVELTKHEIELVRHWIHIGAPHIGTYAALGTGMLWNVDSGAKEKLPASLTTELDQIEDVINRRCASCHTGKKKQLQAVPGMRIKSIWSKGFTHGDPFDRLNINRMYNLTHPEKSRILTTPLARSAGGRGIQNYNLKTKSFASDEVHEVFKSTDDPDYQLLLNAIRKVQHYVETENPAWHMDNFKPNKDYVREMIRYGILPDTFDPAKDPIDVYKTDEAYWKSQWHYAPGTEPKRHENQQAKKYFKVDHTDKQSTQIWELK